MPAALAVRLAPWVAVFLLGAALSWVARGTLADLAELELRDDLRRRAEAHATAVARAERADAMNTKESSQRVDAVEAAREVEVRYVDREVIKYVMQRRDACPMPDQWVCNYNASLGLPCGVSAAPAAGPAPAAGTVPVRGSTAGQ